MRLSNILPVVGAAAVSAAPHLGAVGGLVGGLTSSAGFGKPTACPLSREWEDHVLFEGICAAETETSAAVHLGLHLSQAQIQGDVAFDLVSNFLEEPKIRLGLGGVKAYVAVDISATAAVHESVELFGLSKLELEVPGLEVELGAAIALDLIVGVGAAIDLSAGFYIDFGTEAYVEISLLTKDIVSVSLDGIVTKALPLGIGAGVDLSAEIPITLGLRLRSEIGVGAEVELPILDIEAGADIAIWVSLFDYTAVLVATDNCLVSVKEAFALSLGIVIDLEVEVEDVLELSLAPEVFITVATGVEVSLCLDSRGTPGDWIGGSGPAPSAGVSASATASLLDPAGTSAPGSELASATASAPGSGSGDETDAASTTGPAGGSGGGAAPSGPSGGSPSGGAPGYGAPSFTDVVSGTATRVPSGTAVSDALPATTKGPNGGSGSGSGSGDDLVTSTITNTKVYTITSCAASVVNCPASYTQKVVTSTIDKTVTVCPATETGKAPVQSSTAAPSKPVSVTTITKDLTTVVPCKTRTTSTFTPPTNSPPPPAPTVTIVDKTTVCPKTGESATTAIPLSSATTFQVKPTASVPAQPSKPAAPASSGPAASVPATSEEVPRVSVPATAPVFTAPSGAPSASVPAGAPSVSVPASAPVFTAPSGVPSGSVPASGPGYAPPSAPVVSVPTNSPAVSVPATAPVFTAPSNTPVGSVPVGSPVVSVPYNAPSSPAVPVIPETPVSSPVGSVPPTAPVYTPIVTVSKPIQTQVRPTASVDVPAAPPAPPAYTAPATPGNGTVPSAPGVTASVPSSPPAAETPGVYTAGAATAKAGMVLAAVPVVFALLF